MIATVYTPPTLPASGITLPMNASLRTAEEQIAYRRHWKEIYTVAKYARRIGKSQVRIVGDDSEGETMGGFLAVTFLHRGIMVTARTIFDVQYHYS
jgi:hypothetical protein